MHELIREISSAFGKFASAADDNDKSVAARALIEVLDVAHDRLERFQDVISLNVVVDSAASALDGWIAEQTSADGDR